MRSWLAVRAIISTFLSHVSPLSNLVVHELFKSPLTVSIKEIWSFNFSFHVHDHVLLQALVDHCCPVRGCICSYHHWDLRRRWPWLPLQDVADSSTWTPLSRRTQVGMMHHPFFHTKPSLILSMIAKSIIINTFQLIMDGSEYPKNHKIASHSFVWPCASLLANDEGLMFVFVSFCLLTAS